MLFYLNVPTKFHLNSRAIISFVWCLEYSDIRSLYFAWFLSVVVLGSCTSGFIFGAKDHGQGEPSSQDNMEIFFKMDTKVMRIHSFADSNRRCLRWIWEKEIAGQSLWYIFIQQPRTEKFLLFKRGELQNFERICKHSKTSI